MVKILEDAKGAVFAVSWSSQLLAAGGEDKKVRVYNSAEDSGAKIQAWRGSNLVKRSWDWGGCKMGQMNIQTSTNCCVTDYPVLFWRSMGFPFGL